jgi:hypothetical protein
MGKISPLELTKKSAEYFGGLLLSQRKNKMTEESKEKTGGKVYEDKETIENE